MHRLLLLSLAATLPILTSCNKAAAPLKMTKTEAAPSSVATMVTDDKLSAVISNSSTDTQVVVAPSGTALTGMSVSIRPGSFDRPVQLLLESGAAFADSSMLTEMPLGNGAVVQSAGGGVIIRPSESVDLKVPFQISLPAPQGTALTGSNYAIFYRYLDPATNSLVAGVKPVDGVSASIHVDSATGQTLVQFEGYFGIFWIVQVDKPLTAESVPTPKPSVEPIINKNQTPVIAATGIIAEKTVASTEALPALEIATPVLNVDAASRRFSLIGTPNAKARSCKAEVSENTKLPASISLDATNDFQASGAVVNSEAHTLVGRFRCLDDNGKVASSAWSNSVAVAKLVVKDTTPPVVSTVSPAAQSLQQPTNTKMLVKFSKAMDASTLIASNITLKIDANSTLLNTQISYDAASKSVIVAPTQRLPADTMIRLDIQGVKDSVGNALAQSFSSTFRTEPTGYIWMKGSATKNDPGQRGTKGQAAPDNSPSARWGAAFFIDEKDQIYLYGGSNDTQDMSDLWRFNGTDWAWIGGEDTMDALPVWGTKGVAAATNTPGARDCPAVFYANGQLTMIGGETAAYDEYSDIWTLKDGMWAWIKGPSDKNVAGVFGTKGVASDTANPEPFACAGSARGPDGALYIFGSRTAGNDLELTNQLWKFDGRNWTWLAGNGGTTDRGDWSVKGVADPNVHPSPRELATIWVDKQSRVFVFGGYGYDSTTMTGSLNDLWMFDGTQWTWLSGSNLADQSPVFGTKGVFDAANTPGGFNGAGSIAIDSFGQVWVLGGVLGSDYSNALWSWNGQAWAWMDGSQTPNAPAVRGTKGVFSPSNGIGAVLMPNLAFDSKDHLWIFGGGDAVDGSNGDENSLWRYAP